MELFEKVFSWQEFLDIFNSGTFISIISNTSNEDRNFDREFLNEINKKFHSKHFQISYEAENNKLSYDNGLYPLEKGLLNLIDQIVEHPILINITTMNLQVLGLLLKFLKTNDKNLIVYCMYTEPDRYARAKANRKKFDLHRRMKSTKPIQGYLNFDIDQKPKKKWVPFLGFEGDRALQVRDDFDFIDYIPVITLPSYKPTWQNIIIHQNLPLLHNLGSDSIQYVEADSFMSAYRKLENLNSVYEDYLLRVSPFGTKINAMGIFLYALNHEGKIDIIYDNPIEDDAIISKNVGETHIFDISEFLYYE